MTDIKLTFTNLIFFLEGQDGSKNVRKLKTSTNSKLAFGLAIEADEIDVANVLFQKV